MPLTPESIDGTPLDPEDTRTRFFYRCEPCQKLYTALHEWDLTKFAQTHKREHWSGAE